MGFARVPARTGEPTGTEGAHDRARARPVAAPNGAPAAAASWFALQRSAGNRAAVALATPGAGAPALQRKVTKDGKELTAEDVMADLRATPPAGLDVGLPAVQAAAEAAVNLITYMDLKALRDKVAAVAAAINTGVAPPDRASMEIYEEAGRKKVAGALGVALQTGKQRMEYRTVPASDFAAFLDLHPGVQASLKGVKFALASSNNLAKGAGGMYFHDKREVHVSLGAAGDDPKVFERLLLHEIGHATLQQALMVPNADGTAKEKLSEEATKNTAGRATVPVDEAGLAQYKKETASLNGEGQAFYKAWLTLRQDKAGLFAVSLGGGREEAQRQEYVSKSFTEFCAESFMHYAIERQAFRAYLDALPQKGAAAEVIAAWAAVWSLLQKHGDQILAGTWQYLVPAEVKNATAIPSPTGVLAGPSPTPLSPSSQLPGSAVPGKAGDTVL